MSVEGEVVGVTGSSGCEVERISPSQVTPVSSDTLSSSPDTQPGNNPHPPRPQHPRAAAGLHEGWAGGVWAGTNDNNEIKEYYVYVTQA